jgi:hypothetical protein
LPEGPVARVLLRLAGGNVSVTKPFSEWTVLPHGTLTRLDDNLLSITGTLAYAVDRRCRAPHDGRPTRRRLAGPAKVAEVVPVDASRVDFGDPFVRFFPVVTDDAHVSPFVRMQGEG